MSAKHWIIGCALTFAASAPVAAACGSGDFGDLDVNGTQHTADTTARTVDSGSSSGGDVAGLSHPGRSRATASSGADTDTGSSSGSGSGSNTEDSPASSSARQPTARHAAGWQSLLPGSIQ
jgi:hypothetical protein